MARVERPTPHDPRLLVAHVVLPGGSRGAGAAGQARRHGRRTGLPAGGRGHRPLGPVPDRQCRRRAEHLRIRRGADAVPDRPGTGTAQAVVAAPSHLRLGRLAGGGRERRPGGRRHCLRHRMEDRAGGGTGVVAVVHRHRAGHAGRAQTFTEPGRRGQLFHLVIPGHRRHSHDRAGAAAGRRRCRAQRPRLVEGRETAGRAADPGCVRPLPGQSPDALPGPYRFARIVYRVCAAAGDRYLPADGMGGTVAGAGHVYGRRAAGRFGIPAPADQRPGTVQGPAAGPVLHGGGHVGRLQRAAGPSAAGRGADRGPAVAQGRAAVRHVVLVRHSARPAPVLCAADVAGRRICLRGVRHGRRGARAGAGNVGPAGRGGHAVDGGHAAAAVAARPAGGAAPAHRQEKARGRQDCRGKSGHHCRFRALRPDRGPPAGRQPHRRDRAGPRPGPDRAAAQIRLRGVLWRRHPHRPAGSGRCGQGQRAGDRHRFRGRQPGAGGRRARALSGTDHPGAGPQRQPLLLAARPRRDADRTRNVRGVAAAGRQGAGATGLWRRARGTGRENLPHPQPENAAGSVSAPAGPGPGGVDHPPRPPGAGRDDGRRCASVPGCGVGAAGGAEVTASLPLSGAVRPTSSTYAAA
uniref:Uncharacterized protein n=1 Tax=Tanacetum cinerariifolium TaxID=118510 RepID=A0A699GHK7_TANCI|nr:hypothetical protein [Tanacetum cinerariifolium]